MTPQKKVKKLDRAAAHFVRGLHARGEVAKGKKQLPGITHELVQNKSNESPTLQRKRFSIMG